jgi:outer membrane lipoprotein-sorting protein
MAIKYWGRRLCTLLLLSLISSVALGATDDISRVLNKMDAAAAKFRTMSADFEWDFDQTDPVPDTDIQKGTIFFKRTGTSFQMAAHFREVNGRKVGKILTYSNGTVTLYERATDDFKVFKAGDKQAQLESFLLLGFGTNRVEIERNWTVTYLGSEYLNGIKSEVLELLPRDQEVKETLRKATIWIDPERDVCLKQILDQGPGTLRRCFYTQLRVNEQLPTDAFNAKADPK